MNRVDADVAASFASHDCLCLGPPWRPPVKPLRGGRRVAARVLRFADFRGGGRCPGRTPRVPTHPAGSALGPVPAVVVAGAWHHGVQRGRLHPHSAFAAERHRVRRRSVRRGTSQGRGPAAVRGRVVEACSRSDHRLPRLSAPPRLDRSVRCGTAGCGTDGAQLGARGLAEVPSAGRHRTVDRRPEPCHPAAACTARSPRRRGEPASSERHGLGARPPPPATEELRRCTLFPVSLAARYRRRVCVPQCYLSANRSRSSTSLCPGGRICRVSAALSK